MIRIIDSTLAMMDRFEWLPDQIADFCSLMKSIGILDLEISEDIYGKMGELPEGIRLYMMIGMPEKRHDYPGIYKFLHQKGIPGEDLICQLQINDIREVIQIKSYQDYACLRIKGLDDMICHKYSGIMKNIKENAGKARIIFCPENSFGCATALAVQWILDGNNEISTSFTGIGNRAATEEVLMALRISSRYKVNQDLSPLIRLKEMFEDVTTERVSPNKPVIGEAIFEFEAGVHVDGIIKNPSNFVPFLPEQVGRKFGIRVGKHSGKNAVIYKLGEAGIKMEEEKDILAILSEVKKQGSDLKRGLKDVEFLSIVNEVCADEGKKMDS
ncbi:homocitrate synthase/isopropylmalate synthase family protein [Parasporobacterium paucivorans]|uniref:Homocitrate synthase NifV n=1 Tax=Parasporobacterium paucivorans DSM 15970 TaxID=1122934 RepID=A0A1M6IJK0_9FIRM|nr:hypothetical protein [Parasporobacterium paucivorans]SHJ34569.1 homocitrate synthase NifV [Parasporobacterium paucivorans DSM 15970]